MLKSNFHGSEYTQHITHGYMFVSIIVERIQEKFY